MVTPTGVDVARTAVFCADRHRHYGPDQVEMFGVDRLVAQADVNGCGPHVVAEDATAYRRIRDTVHRASCTVLRGRESLPWRWAEGLEPDFIRLQMQQTGLHGCLKCGAP